MTESSSSDTPSSASAIDPGWEKLDLPAKLLPLVIKAFGTPTEAVQWIELLDKKHSYYWKKSDYLETLATLRINRDAYSRWGDAVNWISYLPNLAKRLIEAGFSPGDATPWIKAGFGTGSLDVVIHHDFDTAMQLLAEWYDPEGEKERYGGFDELVKLFRRGYSVDELKTLLAQGFHGHDVYEWAQTDTGLTREEWLVWRRQGVKPLAIEGFRERGLTPEAAHEWALTGLPTTCIMEAIDFDDTPAEAMERFNPVNQLPGVVEPGKVRRQAWCEHPARHTRSS